MGALREKIEKIVEGKTFVISEPWMQAMDQLDAMERQYYAMGIVPNYANTKSPLGVMPRTIWIEKRVAELARAIKDYSASYPIFSDRVSPMIEWIDELKDLLEKK